MSDARAESLLKSALEKIVYFEARAAQLQGDVASARAEIDKLKEELAGASSRELELRRQVAELEVGAQRAHRERQELGRLNEVLQSERTALLEKLIEASKIQAAGEESLLGNLDLASFISQLRGEVLAAKGEATGIGEPAPSLSALPTTPAAPTGVERHAERFLSEGRLQVSSEELGALAPLRSRTDETLFGFSIRELSAPDASARVRAADRLRTLGQKAAAPALATALHQERDPQVLVALLNAFAVLASKEGLAVALPLLGSESPDVRLAALKAAVALDPAEAAPRIAAAAEDPDPAVRRRAALLALSLGQEQAVPIEERARRDTNADVRRLSALALAAAGGESSRQKLLEALKDPEAKVRRAAAQGLSRLLGQDVSTVVTLEDSARRREIRRLATLPVRPVSAGSAQLGPSRAAVAVAVEAPAEAPAAPLAAVPAAVPVAEALCASILVEIRAAIRGRTVQDLSRAVGAAAPVIEEACGLLVARGQAVRRGLKYFIA